MSAAVEILKKLKGVHTGLALVGIVVIIYFVVRVDTSRSDHLKNGGILACGAEDKTEIIDEGYRISSAGPILSKSGKKWLMKQCTPFPALPKN